MYMVYILESWRLDSEKDANKFFNKTNKKRRIITEVLNLENKYPERGLSFNKMEVILKSHQVCSDMLYSFMQVFYQQEPFQKRFLSNTIRLYWCVIDDILKYDTNVRMKL